MMNTRILLIIALTFCVVLSAAAQTKSSATQVVTFSVKITPKVTATLEIASPSVGVRSSTLDASKAADLIAEVRAGEISDDGTADIQNYLQQSEETFSTVDRTLVFTVSE
jgi:hypothetical protein